MEDEVPKLLKLIPEDTKKWVMRGRGNGFEAQVEKKLELKLGPPRAEDWESNDYFPNARKKVTKRGSLDTKNEAGNNANDNNSEARECKNTSVPVVGWPPVRSFRKNIASSISKPPISLENSNKPEANKKGLFIKINMDGIPIGRKVDLKAYNSYEDLSYVVEELFKGLLAAQKDPNKAEAQNSAEVNQAFRGLLDGSGEYTLVYEDSEGDRMLVGDIPWEMFVSTAKRLRVLKSSDLSTLTLGATSRKRTATDC